MGMVIDNFAGGGGASTGIEAGLGRKVDVAINHWAAALACHEANHPETLHLVEDVFKVDPREVVGDSSVDLAWFSPDCKHHSKAKGGKPVDRKIRGLAWVAVKWAAVLPKHRRPKVIILENVEEFRDWGPLGEDGRPCKRRRGMFFKRFCTRLRNLGYQIEDRILVAADYGAPTTRKRLFVIARCDGKPIVWPERTHAPAAEIVRGDMFAGNLKPWRSAAECIDWSIPCPSIFERKRPLAENTLRRIAEGLRRYVFECAEPFIVPLTHGGGPQRVYGLGDPMKTVTGANRGEMGLVMPYIAGVGARAGQSPPNRVNEPVRTIVSKADRALVMPHLVGIDNKSSGASAAWPIGEPTKTIVTENRHALVTAFLNKHYGGVVGHGVERPIGTITGVDHHSVTTANLVKLYGTSTGADVREPMPTVTATGNHIAEVRAFLIKYYGTNIGQSLREPAHTITSKHRLGLVTIHGQDYQIVDIGLRMLDPRELALAQGFPADYVLPDTKSTAVALIGNSVCPPLAEALVRANCGAFAAVEAVA